MTSTRERQSTDRRGGRLPDVVIIGAMKCGTSTLHRQLAADPRFFMSEPKEPCFFSDDEQWARGLDWYRGLFASAAPDQRCGESSTHYAKLPTHPRTVDRMLEVGLSARFVYVVRDPADRLVSQFIHEWSEGRCGRSIERAVRRLPEMLDYGAYGRQLRPYVDAFGPDRVLVLPFEVMKTDPQLLMAALGRFLEVPNLRWTDLRADNVSSERIRRSVFTEAYSGSLVRRAVKAVLPVSAYERGKRLFQMQGRPRLSDELRRRAAATLHEDAEVLEHALGVPVRDRPWAEVHADWVRSARASLESETVRSDSAGGIPTVSEPSPG